VSPRYHCCIAIFVAQQQVWFPFLIITLHYEYPLGADTVRIDKNFSNMGGGNDDKSFPYFEGTIFSGWLKQFKAVLREFDCDEMIETPIPKDVDANGNPIVMNARERAEFDRKLKEYKDKDEIAYPKIMQACRLNPQTKSLCKTSDFSTANEILVRLRQRFHSVDAMVNASHLLRYLSLKQLETETGAEFVDREQNEPFALREMGINVDDSLRLTKFIQQDTTNSKHKSLAQTIFSTPNMTFSRATSLFELITPANRLMLNQVFRLLTRFSVIIVRKKVTRRLPGVVMRMTTTKMLRLH
jgi:hypothetical protein